MSIKEMLESLAPVESTLPDTNCLQWASSAAQHLTMCDGVDAVVWLIGDEWLLEAPGSNRREYMNIPILF